MVSGTLVEGCGRPWQLHLGREGELPLRRRERECRQHRRPPRAQRVALGARLSRSAFGRWRERVRGLRATRDQRAEGRGGVELLDGKA